MNSWTTEMKQYHTESLDLKTATSQVGMATNKDRVMLCCNTTGNHKLNPLCISQTSSSLCFRYVNMKSLPVINENSSSAWLACETYVSSFESESVPSVRHYLCSKELKLYPDTHLLPGSTVRNLCEQLTAIIYSCAIRYSSTVRGSGMRYSLISMAAVR